MKKITFLIITTLIITGCGQIKEGTAGLIEDGKDSYANVVTEVNEVKEKVEDTKEKIEETVEDIEDAIDKVEDAKQAIDEITN